MLAREKAVHAGSQRFSEPERRANERRGDRRATGGKHGRGPGRTGRRRQESLPPPPSPALRGNSVDSCLKSKGCNDQKVKAGQESNDKPPAPPGATEQLCRLVLERQRDVTVRTCIDSQHIEGLSLIKTSRVLDALQDDA